MAQAKQAVLDSEVRNVVLARLGKESTLKEADINVEVEKGVVILSGFVDHKNDMLAAEHAVMTIGAVRGVADLLQTRSTSERSGREILDDVLRALNSNITVQSERIKVTVGNGKVTLAGAVDNSFQRLMAESIVKRVHGIAGIINNLEVAPTSIAPAQASVEKERVSIEEI